MATELCSCDRGVEGIFFEDRMDKITGRAPPFAPYWGEGFWDAYSLPIFIRRYPHNQHQGFLLTALDGSIITSTSGSTQSGSVVSVRVRHEVHSAPLPTSGPTLW